MLTIQKHKRRIVHFKKPQKIKKESPLLILSLEENIKRLKQDYLILFTKMQLAKDLKFLRRIAINIKHSYYDARQAKHQRRFVSAALKLCHFLSTPLGAPFVTKTTLVNAAFHFSEQDPQHSDLSEILTDFAKYGSSYSEQILRVFNLTEEEHGKTGKNG